MPATNSPAPWNHTVPIVLPDARATPQFLRWLSQQFEVNGLAEGAVPSSRRVDTGSGLIGGGDLSADRTISAAASAILDQLSAVRGSVLYRGAAGWAALAPGTAGQVLVTNGAGLDPAWGTQLSNSGESWHFPTFAAGNGTMSTTAFATKASVVRPFRATTAHAVHALMVGNGNASGEFSAFIAALPNITPGHRLTTLTLGTIGTILGASAPIQFGSTNTTIALQMRFPLTAPVALAAGTDYLVGITRRSDTTTSSVSLVTEATGTGRGFGFGGSFENWLGTYSIASTAMAGGESVGAVASTWPYLAIEGATVSGTPPDIQALLDMISTVHGAIIFRGASQWEALLPDVDGYTLTTHDTGSDPSWTPAAASGYGRSGYGTAYGN